MTLQYPPAPVPQTPATILLPNVTTLSSGLTDHDRGRIEDGLDHSISTNNQLMTHYACRSFQELDLRFATAHPTFYFKLLPRRERPHDPEGS